MDFKDIQAHIKKGRTLPNGRPSKYKHLPALMTSKTFDSATLISWAKVDGGPLHESLFWLDASIGSALGEQPDRRPVNDPVKRKARADQAKKLIVKLTEAIRSFETDEGFSWAIALSLHTQTPCRRLADLYPLTEWKRSIPPKPRLRPGWEEGVNASFLAMPLLLDELKSTVDAWEQREGWPIHASEGVGARKALFVRSLCASFRRAYKRPLHSFVANLANVYFSGPKLMTYQEAIRTEAKNS